MWLLLVYFYFVSTIYGAETQEYSPNIDAIINSLNLVQWNPEETLCVEKTTQLLENVKNSTLWATWVWNANALPGGSLYGSWTHMGHYDQCLNPPWLSSHPQFRSQYCLADVVLTGDSEDSSVDPYGRTEEFFKIPTKYYGVPMKRLQWGVCVPSSCHPHSIAKILKVVYDRTSFTTFRPNITVDHCQVAGEKQQYSVEFYLFLGLIASLFLLAAGSTLYRRYVISDDESNGLDAIITKSFCMIRNYQNLLKENKGEIKVMNGMRFITSVIIIALHQVFIMMVTGFSNPREYEKDVAGFFGIFLHLDIVVDTFFAMSGLLYIKGLLANPERQGILFMVLWKRYLRLIGPFAVTIFYVTWVLKYTGSGPVFQKNNQLEFEVCSRSWPLSFLMLNTDARSVCHAVTWYISCDYQLAVLGTVLFFFYQKDRRLGFAAFGTAAVFSMIIPGVLTYWYRLPAIHFLNLETVIFSIRNYWEASYTYTASYSRAGAYMAGVAMGYLMSVYKPADYRNTISKKWSILGTGICSILMVLMLSLGKFFVHREYYLLEHIIATVTNRVVWAAAICCIIGFCEYGTVPVVSGFLGWSVFTPLSRLSYGIYVIHTLVIQLNMLSTRVPLRHSPVNLLVDVVGTLTISIALSFVMWLLVEAPAINLSNQLLYNKSKSIEQSKEKEKNGVPKQNGVVKTKAS